MAFYKKQKLGKKWYPRAVTGKSPFTTDDVAARLSKISTVSRGDTYAVLANLGDVLADMLSTGQSATITPGSGACAKRRITGTPISTGGTAGRA